MKTDRTTVGSAWAAGPAARTLPAARPRGAGRAGFTLVELLVVIGVIAIVAAIALPGILSVFSAGSDAEAYNLMAAELTSARSEALRDANYVGVHVQLADAPQLAATGSSLSGVAGRDYMAVVEFDRSKGAFGICADYLPRPVPGTMAFGELDSKFIGPSGNFQNISGQDSPTSQTGTMPDFTSLTIVFSPAGQAVRQLDTGLVKFNPGDPLFSGAGQLWNVNIANGSGGDGEEAVDAMVMFDYGDLVLRSDADKLTYLNTYGQFLPMNVLTGQLFPRE